MLYYWRRLIFGGATILYIDHPLIQLSTQTLFTMATIYLHVSFMHLDSKLSNIIEIHNEFCYYIIVLLMYSLCDYVTDIDLRYNIGWAISFLTIYFFGVNIVGLFGGMFYNLGLSIKEKCRKR